MPNLPTKKQLRAYFLVEVMGESQAEAARLMGIERSAVSRLLTRFYKGMKATNKGPGAKTIRLPENFDELSVKDVF